MALDYIILIFLRVVNGTMTVFAKFTLSCPSLHHLLTECSDVWRTPIRSSLQTSDIPLIGIYKVAFYLLSYFTTFEQLFIEFLLIHIAKDIIGYGCPTIFSLFGKIFYAKQSRAADLLAMSLFGLNSVGWKEVTFDWRTAF